MVLEFEADPCGGGEGGGVEEAAGWTGEPVVHAGPEGAEVAVEALGEAIVDRKSTRLNSSHSQISYAVFCLKKKKKLTLIDKPPSLYPGLILARYVLVNMRHVAHIA